ncbi:hypothetical protein B0H17DRAFT_1196738 [Mycena rosella]|uniref:Uncharacterized protein n=1 Tax=Mycena rosella TaxID=1033263 RepID=A0AAD7DUK5_MYCRO|nr:hypothetical protein B0H17DRAFT_1196738 [Mycena rosella]
MRFLFFAALAVAAPLASSAVPIPQTRVVSPYITRFSQRSTPHRVRSNAAGLVSRIPDILDITRVDGDDVFLARALEGTVFASAHDVAQRSYLGRPPTA